MRGFRKVRKIMALGLAPALLMGIVPVSTVLASPDIEEIVKTSTYGLTDDFVLFDFTEKEIMKSLQAELSDGCISFSDSSYSQRNDSIALRDENILDSYINTGIISDSSIAEAIRKRKIYPCSFGSGLKMTGIDNFIEMLS